MMEDGNTYLEEFLLSLEMIPNDIRRDFELVSLHNNTYNQYVTLKKLSYYTHI